MPPLPPPLPTPVFRYTNIQPQRYLEPSELYTHRYDKRPVEIETVGVEMLTGLGKKKNILSYATVQGIRSGAHL